MPDVEKARSINAMPGGSRCMHRLQPAFDGIEVMDVGPIDALAPVFRKFVLTGMAPQSDTRKPLVFYNTCIAPLRMIGLNIASMVLGQDRL